MTEIEQMMEQFAQDYDLSSMNYNDKLALEVLCGLYVQVQDNVKEIEESKGEKGDRIFELVELNRKLITNIETLEKQLGISRKARGKDKETSVINYMAELQQKAKGFLEKKLRYFYCPECSMLLATMWFLYPEENNQIHFTCGRCKKEITFFTDEYCSTEETTKVIQERKHE